MSSRLRRHQRILELIAASPVRSQHDLQEMLSSEGLDVTQATLSRDLRELNVVKGPRGYIAPGEDGPTPPDEITLRQTLRRELLGINTGGTLVVLKTRPGHANALAVDLDRYRLEGVIGTVAGDDTVFLATSGARQARDLAAYLGSLQ